MGSNLDSPVSQLQRAYESLQLIDFIEISAHSALYQSPPFDRSNQPNYVNAVLQFSSAAPPAALLDTLLSIESEQGRVRSQHWGPRIIDLDLLLCGDETINTNRLTLPHPGLLHRAFVLQPMADIAPEWILPNGKTVVEQLESLELPLRLEAQLTDTVTQ